MLIHGSRKSRWVARMRNVVREDDALPAGLPPELVGKSEAEIAAYYASFQERVMENARRIAQGNNPPPPPGTPPPPASPTPTLDLNTITEAAWPGLVAMAKMTASAGKPDFDSFLPKIQPIIDSLPRMQQIDSNVWVECYYNVKGRATDALIESARRSAMGLEPPAPPPTAPAKPRTFTDTEEQVIAGMGIDRSQYVDAEQKLESGFQPFTTNNKTRRVAA